MAKSIMHPYQGDFNTVEPLILLISIVVPVLGLAKSILLPLGKIFIQHPLTKNSYRTISQQNCIKDGGMERNPHFKYIMGWFFECMNSIHATLYLRAAQLSTNLAMVSTCCIWHFGKALKADTLCCHG